MTANGLEPLDESVVYGLGYKRISGRKEQRDSALSIPAQDGHITLAMEREHVLYYDGDDDILSGRRSDRRGYQRILATTRRLRAEGKQVAIFVIRLDRFGRDMEERTSAWRQLLNLGARLYSISQGGWVTDPFIYNLDAALSQREIDLTSQRVKETNEFIRRNGFPIVGRVAWGYRVRKATEAERRAGSGRAMIEPHPIEAPVVREAFRMRAEGASLSKVHAWMLTLSDRETGGRALPRDRVRKLFAAAVYVGRHDYPKGHAGGRAPVLARDRCTWEPLVDDETYARAQWQTTAQQRRPKQATGNHLLTGMLICPRCSAKGRVGRMVGRMTTRTRVTKADPIGRREVTPEYKCSHFQRGRNALPTLTLVAADGRTVAEPCVTVMVAATLDADVLARVGRLFDLYQRPEVRQRLGAAWARVMAGDGKRRGGEDLGRQIAGAEQRMVRWNAAFTAAYADYTNGDLDQQEYREVRARARGEVEDAEKEIARLRDRLRAEAAAGAAEEEAAYRRWGLGEVLTFVAGWRPALEAADTAARRAVLLQLIERVEPVRLGRGRYRAKITWTRLGRLLRATGRAASGGDGGVTQGDMAQAM